jgi:selenocysteine lyase/cysteine desulfurase
MKTSKTSDMLVNRRDLLALAAALPLSSMASTPDSRSLVPPSEFALTGVNLNGAGHHPLPVRTAAALRDYAIARTKSAFTPSDQGEVNRRRATDLFGEIINASSEELMLVPSTSYAESMLVAALGLENGRGRVVSDVFHWKSSLFQYSVLAKAGLEFVVVPQRDGRIELDDLDKEIRPGTRLVSVSLVSYKNGFEHDIRALADLAHSRGALLYVDAAQAAGAVPMDLKALGMDFCACSGFKWLMAESGAGFLYARAGVQEELTRKLCGYGQLVGWDVVEPSMGAAPQISYTERSGLAGKLSIGSISNSAILALSVSLQLIKEIGVNRIYQSRQPLLRRLEREMRSLGYASLTPIGSTSPIATYKVEGAMDVLSPILDRAGISVSIGKSTMRVSPSIYNNISDIDALLEQMSNYRKK